MTTADISVIDWTYQCCIFLLLPDLGHKIVSVSKKGKKEFKNKMFLLCFCCNYDLQSATPTQTPSPAPLCSFTAVILTIFPVPFHSGLPIFDLLLCCFCFCFLFLFFSSSNNNNNNNKRGGGGEGGCKAVLFVFVVVVFQQKK